MMITGLVLLRLTAGREKLAMAKLKEIKGVSHLSAVFGRWDLVADIEAADLPFGGGLRRDRYSLIVRRQERNSLCF